MAISPLSSSLIPLSTIPLHPPPQSTPHPFHSGNHRPHLGINKTSPVCSNTNQHPPCIKSGQGYYKYCCYENTT